MSEVRDLATGARQAAIALASTSTDQRNRALLAMSHALVAKQDEIIAANAKPTWTPRAPRAPRRLSLDRLELNRCASRRSPRP